jgi:hypothetical protein
LPVKWRESRDCDQIRCSSPVAPECFCAWGECVGGRDGGAQWLAVAAAPILTRLFTPEDCGLLAVYASLCALIGVMSSLRDDLAIPLPEDDVEAANVLAALICSMSRKGNCWNNAPTESGFNSFKNERVFGERFLTRDAMKAAAFESIEVFYNRKRLHSTLGYTSPAGFLKDWINTRENEEQVA